MKRYVRASLDPSVPEWLRDFLEKKGSALSYKFRIALDTAKIKNGSPRGNALPIYLLNTDWGEVVYIPGFNDYDQYMINNRYRKLGGIAKSKLPEMSREMAYIDLDDPASTYTRRSSKYEDPRWSNRQKRYAGQYREKDGSWSTQGFTPYDEPRARDKSGYKIPSPEERISMFYERFPEKLTNKVEDVYQKLIEYKNRLNSVDFNSPYSPGVEISSAFNMFGQAVRAYQVILSNLDKISSDTFGYYHEEYTPKIIRDISSINYMLDKADDYLTRS